MIFSLSRVHDVSYKPDVVKRIRTLILLVCMVVATPLSASEVKQRTKSAGLKRVECAGEAVKWSDLATWDIVVAKTAIPAEQTAADQLQLLLKQAGVGELPIVPEPNSKHGHVFVGRSKAMLSSDLGFDTEEYGPEKLRIRAADSSMVIAGGRPRGTLYAVYVFAETSLGVRFLTGDHTVIPKVPSDAAFGPIDWRFEPVLQYRGIYSGILSDPEFASRLRLNALVKDDEAFGGLTRYRLINHTFQNLLPSRRYGKEHPEWYALRNGKRRWAVKGRDWAWDGTEPCCTNHEVIETIAKNTLKYIEKHPDIKNVSVSQNDNKRFCQCPECAAVDKAENSHMGSLLRLVNQVAETVEQKHPDMMVGTLAYRYSRKPPDKTKPRENVQVQLCSFEACQIHPLNQDDCPENAAFDKDLQGWAEICENIYIWHYVVNFRNYLAPCMNFGHLGRDIRFLTDHNVKGIMAQAAWNARNVPFAELRNYVLANMLWDPDHDPERLTTEFIHLRYGKAAPHIRALLQVFTKAAGESGHHAMCAQALSAYGIDLNTIEAAEKHLQSALNAVKDKAVKARLQKCSVVIPAARVALLLDPLFLKARREKKDIGEVVQGLEEETKTELFDAASKLYELMVEHDISNFAEGLNRKTFKKVIRKVTGKQLSVPSQNTEVK